MAKDRINKKEGYKKDDEKIKIADIKLIKNIEEEEVKPVKTNKTNKRFKSTMKKKINNKFKKRNLESITGIIEYKKLNKKQRKYIGNIEEIERLKIRKDKLEERLELFKEEEQKKNILYIDEMYYIAKQRIFARTKDIREKIFDERKNYIDDDKYINEIKKEKEVIKKEYENEIKEIEDKIKKMEEEINKQKNIFDNIKEELKTYCDNKKKIIGITEENINDFMKINQEEDISKYIELVLKNKSAVNKDPEFEEVVGSYRELIAIIEESIYSKKYMEYIKKYLFRILRIFIFIKKISPEIFKDISENANKDLENVESYEITQEIIKGINIPIELEEIIENIRKKDGGTECVQLYLRQLKKILEYNYIWIDSCGYICLEDLENNFNKVIDDVLIKKGSKEMGRTGDEFIEYLKKNIKKMYIEILRGEDVYDELEGTNEKIEKILNLYRCKDEVNKWWKNFKKNDIENELDNFEEIV